MQVDMSISILILQGLLCQQTCTFNGASFFILFYYLHICTTELLERDWI